VKGQCVEKSVIPPGYGTIVDFKNEIASFTQSPDGYGVLCSKLYGYTSATQITFLSELNYQSNPYLYYDGHPGYDYPFAHGTPLYPAVSGCVTPELCTEFGPFGADR